ncbi:hypothetical protein Tco_1089322 [Tanacetum coccineum]
MPARIAKAELLLSTLFSVRGIEYLTTDIHASISSLALPVRKRYRGTEEDEEDKSSDADDEREKATPEGQQTVLVVGTVVSEPLGLGYEAAKSLYHSRKEVYTDIPTYAPPDAPVQTPQSPKWSLGSLPVSPSSSVVLLPIALLEEEEVAPQRKQHQVVQVVDTTMYEPLGLGYKAARCRALELTELGAQVEF